jgi:hypothetical protein
MGTITENKSRTQNFPEQDEDLDAIADGFPSLSGGSFSLPVSTGPGIRHRTGSCGSLTPEGVLTR